MQSTEKVPRTKEQLAWAIKDKLGLTFERGICEAYEFETTRRRTLLALYEAIVGSEYARDGKA